MAIKKYLNICFDRFLIQRCPSASWIEARVVLCLCVYPALEAVAVESQLVPLFLHLLQLLLQLLDLFLTGDKTRGRW